MFWLYAQIGIVPVSTVGVLLACFVVTGTSGTVDALPAIESRILPAVFGTWTAVLFTVRDTYILVDVTWDEVGTACTAIGVVFKEVMISRKLDGIVT